MDASDPQIHKVSSKIHKVSIKTAEEPSLWIELFGLAISKIDGCQLCLLLLSNVLLPLGFVLALHDSDGVVKDEDKTDEKFS